MVIRSIPVPDLDKDTFLIAAVAVVAIIVGCFLIGPHLKRFAQASSLPLLHREAGYASRNSPSRRARRARQEPAATTTQAGVDTKYRGQPQVKQPYDAFLVLDVEGTCTEGSSWDWPNEIIEWPICLMRWRTVAGLKQLEVIDTYRSFVRPTWKPQLSEFCTRLTGVTQAQVNQAPTFIEVTRLFAQFLVKHGLIDPTGQRLVRFCWCSDGPYDIRDFVAKQCFISKIATPEWLEGDVIDVSLMVSRNIRQKFNNKRTEVRKGKMKISEQLSALGLGVFEGRLHSGIDDARNIARILSELGRRQIRLVPNRRIVPGRRWPWMGENGAIIQEHYQSPS